MSVQYEELLDTYTVRADFKKKGTTELVLRTPDDKTIRYDLDIGMLSYELTEQETGDPE